MERREGEGGVEGYRRGGGGGGGEGGWGRGEEEEENRWHAPS